MRGRCCDINKLGEDIEGGTIRMLEGTRFVRNMTGGEYARREELETRKMGKYLAWGMNTDVVTDRFTNFIHT